MDLTKVMKKGSVQVKIRAVVWVQVTTGESERSVGLDGDTWGAQGAAWGAGRGTGGGGTEGTGGSMEGRAGHRLQPQAPLSVVLPTRPRSRVSAQRGPASERRTDALRASPRPATPFLLPGLSVGVPSVPLCSPNAVVCVQPVNGEQPPEGGPG